MNDWTITFKSKDKGTTIVHNAKEPKFKQVQSTVKDKMYKVIFIDYKNKIAGYEEV